jgi:endonuclease/exonuclease/phosphatase family metal-dependent hydrolase
MLAKTLVRQLLLAALTLSGVVNGQIDTLRLRSITFNIRYDSGHDKGEKPWDVRRQYVVNQLSEAAKVGSSEGYLPVIGLQEALHNQVLDVREGLERDLSERWDYIGWGRDDGKELGEYNPIFYPTDTVKMLQWTQKWLSPTPGVPSKWPTAGSNRIVVIGLFETRADNKQFIVANTHLDNESSDARLAGVAIALEEIRKVQSSWPGGPFNVTLTGDFNSQPGEDAYDLMVAEGYLNDTYSLAKVHEGPWPTYTSFEPNPAVEKHIDYIWVGPHDGFSSWTVDLYQVLDNRLEREGFYISDHRAVLTNLRLTI